MTVMLVITAHRGPLPRLHSASESGAKPVVLALLSGLAVVGGREGVALEGLVDGS